MSQAGPACRGMDTFRILIVAVAAGLRRVVRMHRAAHLERMNRAVCKLISPTSIPIKTQNFHNKDL